MAYFWFHAFKRPTIQETIEVLRRGPSINPSPLCTTQVNENELQIKPACVYAYLGRTDELFGNSALSLPLDALVGTVSPFDTGGLVSHIVPLKDWTSDARRSYLNHFSWPADKLPALLDVYPQAGSPKRRAYLRSDRPKAEGPHEVWPTKAPAFVASIWSDPNEWRAWLWEGRSANRLKVDGNLVAWSCSNTAYGEIRRQADDATDPAEIAWFESLLQKFVGGGVSVLVQSLMAEQEVA